MFREGGRGRPSPSRSALRSGRSWCRRRSASRRRARRTPSRDRRSRRLGAEREAPGAGRRERQRDRHGDRRDVSPGGPRLLAQHREALRERLGRQAERLPAVTEPRRPADRRAADPADHDRESASAAAWARTSCRRSGSNGRRSAGPPRLHSVRMTAIASSVKAPRSLNAVPIASISFSIAPTPMPRIEPAAAQDVERRRRLREPDRVVIRQHEHGRAQAHALWCARPRSSAASAARSRAGRRCGRTRARR